MAIDAKSLSDIISGFRALSAKDSVAPESLGYILQRIADLLATFQRTILDFNGTAMRNAQFRLAICSVPCAKFVVHCPKTILQLSEY